MSNQLVGQSAPDFSLKSSTDEVVKLSDYDGKWKVYSSMLEMDLLRVREVV